MSCFVADTGAHAQLITACLAASTFQLSGVNEAVERHTTSVCDFLWIRRMCRIQKRSKRRALCMDTAVELNDTGYLAFGCDRAWVFSSIATDRPLWMTRLRISFFSKDKKHLKNVGPIRYCKPPHAHSPDVASGTVARRLRIDVHDNDDNDNAWQRGPLWPHGMGPINEYCIVYTCRQVADTTDHPTPALASASVGNDMHTFSQSHTHTHLYWRHHVDFFALRQLVHCLLKLDGLLCQVLQTFRAFFRSVVFLAKLATHTHAGSVYRGTIFSPITLSWPQNTERALLVITGGYFTDWMPLFYASTYLLFVLYCRLSSQILTSEQFSDKLLKL